MKNLIVTLIIITTIILVEWFSYKGLNLILKENAIKGWIKYIYWGHIPLLILLSILNNVINPQLGNIKSFYNYFLIATFLILIFAPKLIIAASYIVNEIIEFVFNGTIYVINKIQQTNFKSIRFLYFVYIGVFLAISLFIFLFFGHLHGRFNYKTNHIQLSFNTLPSEFNSFKIVQISDLHIGSYLKHKDKLEKAIQKINKPEPDIIVFTGDLVNNFAGEAEPFVDILKQLKSKYGNYSILGNHDYGDYVNWKSEEDKNKNLQKLINIHKKAGFDILLNESRTITINKDSIDLIGIENWGLPPFPQHGDLQKALNNVNQNGFKILLSHDPSHWDAEVKEKTNINLTLSGHTHGMQFGIFTKNIKWSPVQWKYPKWGGLYKEKNQYLYVNVGLGNIGYLGRVGIRPEITEIILKKTE